MHFLPNPPAVNPEATVRMAQQAELAETTTGMMPKEWEFGGYCPTEEMAEKLLQFRQLNRRIYIVDHHARAWKVAITHLDITPRLRHVYNGEVSDWGSDFRMTVVVLDQEPTLVS